jgi:large subunit ribosomal protein L4
VAIVDRFGWGEPRTKLAKAFLATAGLTGKVLVVLGTGDTTAALSFRNLPAALVLPIGQLNTHDVLWADTVVFTTDTLSVLTGQDYEVSDEDFVREAADDEGGEGA